MDLWKAFAGQNWSFYTHQKLYDMVITEARGASAVGPADEAWTKFTELMEESRNDIEEALKDAGTSWEGLAAESMTTGVTPLAQWADDASTAGGASGTGVRNVGELFAFVSKAMPEPVRPPDPASIFAEVLEGQADADQREREAQQARLRAVELMKGYSENSEFAVSRLGTFIPPRSVTVAVASPELASGSIHHTTGEFTVPPTPAAGPKPDLSTVDTPVTPAREGETRTSAASTPATTPGPASTAELRPVVPALPAVPQSSGVPAASGFAGTRAPARQEYHQSAGRQGGGAAAGRGGGTTGTVPPGAGRPGAAHAAGFRAGGAGTTAVGPVGGPVGAGVPANREEDTEHVLPDYLRAYHDEFWVGDAPPAPPVIGGED